MGTGRSAKSWERQNETVTMQTKEAETLFRESQQRYQEGQYAEALERLDTVNGAFPNDKAVMYLRAQCLAHLFRTVQAVKACDRLLSRHHCPEAKELKDNLIKYDGLKPPGVDDGDPLPEPMIDLNLPKTSNGAISIYSIDEDRPFPLGKAFAAAMAVLAVVAAMLYLHMLGISMPELLAALR